MLINKLNSTNCPTAQAALISTARDSNRKLIERTLCPNQLLSLSEKIYRASKMHPAANILQCEAELATQKAIGIQQQPENIAASVIYEGAHFFKQHGKRISTRIFSMYNRYSYWTDVHVRLVSKSFGGSSFQWLRDNNKLQLTSEWFVARHARHLVPTELLCALDTLLSGDNAPATAIAA